MRTNAALLAYARQSSLHTLLAVAHYSEAKTSYCDARRVACGVTAMIPVCWYLRHVLHDD